MTTVELKEYIRQHPDMSDKAVGESCGYSKSAVTWHRRQLGIFREKIEPIDEIGNRYGKLTVLYKDSTSTRNDGTYWVCQCDCGNLTTVKASNLRCAHPTRSCGCDAHGRGRIAYWDNGVWKRIDETHIQHHGCGHVKLKGKATRTYKGICPICAEQERLERNAHRCMDCGCVIEVPKKLCPTCKAKHEVAKQEKKKIKRRSKYLRNERTRYAHAKKNGKVDWTISLEKLMKRDGNICALCGEPVDVNAYRITEEGHFIAHGKYPSIDHIVPLSRGGTHTWGNVQLAHCSCNAVKGDTIEGTQ